jgi:hypothetical protein
MESNGEHMWKGWRILDYLGKQCNTDLGGVKKKFRDLKEGG